jgi:hypothetical protein
MKQPGFVLITVIVILSVLTGLVMANMRWIAVDWRRYNDLQRFQKQIQKIEDVAETLGAKLANHALQGCILANQDEESTKFDMMHKGCRIAEHYRYGITDLGVFPCVKLPSKLSTHHWLLTMVDEQLNHKWLQLRIATAEPYQPCQHGRPVTVQSGILTRHWIKS